MKSLLLVTFLVFSPVLIGCSALAVMGLSKETEKTISCEESKAPPSELVRSANVGGIKFIALPAESLAGLITEVVCYREALKEDTKDGK